MKLNFVFFLTLSLFLGKLYGQDTIPYIDFDEIQEKSEQLLSEKRFHDAFLEYNKIDRNDSNYLSSLVTKSYYLLNDEELDSTRYDQVLEIVQEGLDNPNIASKLHLYTNKGATLLRQKRYDAAIKNYDEAIAAYPKNYTFYYNQALAYENLEKYTEAAELYKKSLIINPFYADAHLQLGNLCYRSNKVTEALMAINLYLLLNPDGENSLDVLSALNTIVSSKLDIENPIEAKISKDDETFEELDLLINNKISLNKKYKIKNKIKIALVKQNHLLFDQLKNYEGNNGFFHNRYVPFYNWIRENNQFDNFIYTICFSVTAKPYKDIVKSKTKDVVEFYPIASGKLGDFFGKTNKNFNHKEQDLTCIYENKLLVGIGKISNDKKVGLWEVFASDGYIISKGSFNETGEREGKWLWLYEDGTTKEEVYYKNGKLDGSFTHYYGNGKVNYITNYSDGDVNGEYRLYSELGALIEVKLFKESLVDGAYKSYYNLGENYLEYDMTYKAGKINGKVLEYHVDGTILMDVNFVDGKREGMEKRFYKNGALLSEIEYKDGMLDGIYKTYYSNGEIESIGKTIENENVGDWKVYHPNKNIKTELSYEKGKINGVYKDYDTDGKLVLTYDYKKGEIYTYSFFNKEGIAFHSGDKKRNNLPYKSFHPNGNLRSEGLYDIKGGKQGEWKFYTKNEVLNSVDEYKDGLIDGYSTFYFENGKKEVVRKYKEDKALGYYLKQDRLGQKVKHGWFKDGAAHGVWKTYFPNKELRYENYYFNGKLEGEQRYYSVDGKLSETRHYKNDDLISEFFYDNKGKIYDSVITSTLKLDTIYTHYFNGKLYSKLTYSYGIKNGKYVGYYADGSIRAEGQYLNMKQNGEWVWYHENGKIETKCSYVYGDLDGNYTEYHDNGKIKETKSYILGDLHGESKEYGEEGILKRTANYEYGVSEGKRNFYSEEGHLQLIRFYHNDQIIGYSYLDKNGKELPMISVKNETAKIVSYFDNGIKAREMEVVNGDFENKYLVYYYSGQLYRELNYENDLQVGVEKIFYPSGKIKKVENYTKGLANGKFISYYENGKVKKEENYLLGELNGKSISYNNDGSVSSQKNYFNGDLLFD